MWGWGGGREGGREVWCREMGWKCGLLMHLIMNRGFCGDEEVLYINS